MYATKDNRLNKELDEFIDIHCENTKLTDNQSLKLEEEKLLHNFL